ncbi:GNAT family N-acetyltransferase [Nonomuraea sp. NBC_01738]|uniref:GNAT family N-acetyltransferase n=1 Tax=Nonomuraea sp. NBC_01738 TaxID=2976003 RepID=UPI002E12E50D|nr:GNAT family N-acetyltransferase [Nonomuraea sp. NBC_01738]
MTPTWGPLREDDAGRWADLAGAIEAEDRIGEHFTASDLAEKLRNPLLDRELGTLAARDGDRLVAVGYLPIRPWADPAHLVTLWGGVHPEHRRRGYGRRLLDWSAQAARTLHDRAYPGKPLELHLNINDTNAGAMALAESSGFVEARWFFQMEHDLKADIPAKPLPEGVRITPYTPDLDFMAVRNAAFRDHWGSGPHTPQSWQANIVGPHAFRPEASFAAMRNERPIAILITHRFEAHVAWIQIIGTLREARGKGVASALIAHALTAFKQQGYGTAGLSVDATNATGALGVYERAGFAVARRTVAYAKPLVTPA